MQLFVDRAAAVRSDFALTAENATAVAELCDRLDGLPLALELAAARIALLSPREMLEQLEQRFAFLVSRQRDTPARHRTLLAVIESSYQLLDAELQRFFARLSVFRGGLTLEAATAVCDFGFWTLDFGLDSTKSKTPDDSVHPPLPAIQNPKSKIQNTLDYLEQLRDCSLLTVEAAQGEGRYRMLETVREYAWEQLAASGERADIRSRHRDWFLQLAEQADVAHGPEQPAWLARLEAERDNWRAALGWCQEAADADPAPPGTPSAPPAPRVPASGGTHPALLGTRLGVGDGAPGAAAEAGLRLATALWSLWRRRGYLAEGMQWLEGALARGSQLPASLRAPAFLRAARLAGDRGDRERASSLLLAARQEYEKALALARGSGNRREIADAVLGLAEAAHRIMDVDSALSHAEEARQQMEALGDRGGLMRAMWVMAHLALWRGNRQAARPLMEDLVSLVRESGDSERLIHALGGVGHLERDDGNYDQARARYQESLILRREVGHQFELAQSLEDFAVLAGREQQLERAIRLLGAGEAFCETLGAQQPVADAPEYERTVAEGRAALGEAAFAVAWAEGRAMSLDQAIEYALSEV